MLQFRLLVIDDNKSFLSSAIVALKHFSVDTASSISEAREKLTNEYDLFLLDLVFDDKDPDLLQGMEFLKYIHENFPYANVIIMTNYSSTDITVNAIKSGAVDFINKKELNWSEWRIRIENYCKNSSRIKQLEEKARQLEEKYDPTEIIGISREIEYIRKRLKDLAQNSDDISLLITGETGTGKNLAAKYFRKYSRRNKNPFIEFSIFEITESLMESELFGHVKGAFTGAIQDKKGLFEEADGGILFLDEIGDYDLRIQKKVMRFLEEKVITRVGSSEKTQIDTQLILATNQNIPKLISEGKFREDLYHRINRINITLPPLRERIEDIVFLTDYFFNYFKEKEKTNLLKISPDVYSLFEKYNWPGNVRELQSVIWDACTKARLTNDKTLRASHLRDEIKAIQNQNNRQELSFKSLNQREANMELESIETALHKFNGNKSQACAELGLTLDQMRYKIVKYSRIISNHDEKYPLINNLYSKHLSIKIEDD